MPKLGERFAAVQSGELDASIVPEPFGTINSNNGGKTLWENTDYITNLTWYRDQVKENDKAFKDFHKAVNEAIVQMQEKGEDAYKKYVVQYGIMDEETVDMVTLPNYRALEPPTKEQYSKVQKWMIDHKLIEKEFTIDQLIIPFK